MEPWPGVRRVCPFLHPGFPARQRRGRRCGRHRRDRGRPRDFERRFPPDLPSSTAGLSLGVRRQHERPDAEAARHRPADPAADGRRAGGGGRSGSARDQGERRRSAAAHLRDAGVPGKRRVHRRGALSAAAPDAAAADGRLRVRGQRPARSGRREAARLDHRLAVGERQGSREGIPPPQRQGEARGRQLHGRQLPHPGDRDRRRDRQPFRGAQERFQDSGEAQDPLSADRRRSAARQDDRAGRRHRARVQQQQRAVHDAGAGPRQPHPAEDRRQGRRRGEGEGGGAAQAGARRRRFRGAREEEFRRRGQREERRRPRLLRPRPHGAGVRSDRLSRCSPARSATW